MNGGEKQDKNQNEVNMLNTIQKIIDRSNTEIDRVYKIYRLLAGLVALIALVSIAAFGMLYSNNVKDIRNDLKEQMNSIEKNNAQEMKDTAQRTSDEFKGEQNHIKSELENNVTDIGNKVNKRIEDEFNKDNINNLVASKAEERIDKVADQLIEKQIAKKIDPQIKVAEGKIQNIDQTVTKINEDVKDIKSQNDFALVFSNAQANDRTAFNQLLIWRNDESSPYHYKAMSAAEKIMQDHQPPFLRDPIDIQQSGKDELSKFKMPELRNIYNSIDTTKLEYSRSKPCFIKYVWHREDISTKEKMQFLVDIMKQEKDLNTLEYVGQCFKEVSKQIVYNIATDDLLGWWDEHKDDIK